MSDQGKYQKIATDPEKVVDGPPPYALKVGQEEERLLIRPDDGSVEHVGCTPGRLCLSSVLAAMFCFWPAAIVGMIMSIKARYAENDRARRYLRIGKKFVWASFFLGLVALVVVAGIQLAAIHRAAWRGAMKGYVAGLEDGATRGATDAKTMAANGVAKFPEAIPGADNVLDINSAFWDSMFEVESPKGAAKLVGHAFGYVDGYKKGFCSTENTNCEGVALATVADRLIDCPRMRAKLERMQKKYAAHKGGDDEHDHDDDEDELAPLPPHDEHRWHGHHHGRGHHGKCKESEKGQPSATAEPTAAGIEH